MKRFFVILLSLIMGMAIFSGCSQGTKEEYDPSGKLIIDLWLQPVDDYDMLWWVQQVADFNKLPDKEYSIKLTWVEESNWDNKLSGARRNNTPPDIINLPISGAAQQSLMGALEPLNNFVSEEFINELDPAIRESITSKDGKIYGYPKYLEPSAMLYYRKDLLADAGFTVDDLSTMDGLETVAKAMTHKIPNSNNVFYGFQIPTTESDLAWVSWYMMQQTTGHLALNEDWSAATVSDFGDVMDFYKDVRSWKSADGSNVVSGNVDYSADDANILKGNCAMQMCGSWIWGNMMNKADFKDMRDKIGVVPMPALKVSDENKSKTTDTMSTLGGWSLCIDKLNSEKNKKYAGDFIEWLYGDDDRLMEYFEAGAFCKESPRTSMMQKINEHPQAKTSEIRKVLTEIVPKSIAEPTYPWTISSYIGTQINAYLRGTDKTSALTKAEGDINIYIKTNNLAGNNF